MSLLQRTHPVGSVVVAVVLAAVILAGTGALTPARSAADPSLGQLSSQLGAQQARQQHLAAGIGSLSHLIDSLGSQIALVQGREAAVAAQLARDRAQLATVRGQLAAERVALTRLRDRLAGARRLLADQLVSGYESTQPDLVSVVLDAHGFTDLLEQLNFLGRVEHQQQSIIAFTRVAKAQAARAAARLASLQRTDARITQAAELRARALAGFNALLESKQSALAAARSAQSDALAASRAASQGLAQRISKIKAEQAAAAAAAAQRAANATPAAPSAPTTSGASGPAPGTAPLGPGGGWAIPYAIVLCESGGQNLPPNSAGASGYYQIIPSTWTGFGGTGPAAYLASKAEQDAVATRIWNGGAGASNWVCAGIVGIH